MILLDSIGLMVTLVGAIHLKTKSKSDFEATESEIDKNNSNFDMSLVLIALLVIRLTLMIVAECVRSRHYGSRIEVRHNH